MNRNPWKIPTGTVTSKYQLTIPKALATRLGIPRGDKVDFWVENGSIVLKPVKTKGNPLPPIACPGTPDGLKWGQILYGRRLSPLFAIARRSGGPHRRRPDQLSEGEVSSAGKTRL